MNYFSLSAPVRRHPTLNRNRLPL